MRIRIARAWVCDSVTAGALGALAAGFFAGSACAYAVPAPVSTATDAHSVVTAKRHTGVCGFMGSSSLSAPRTVSGRERRLLLDLGPIQELLAVFEYHRSVWGGISDDDAAHRTHRPGEQYRRRGAVPTLRACGGRRAHHTSAHDRTVVAAAERARRRHHPSRGGALGHEPGRDGLPLHGQLNGRGPGRRSATIGRASGRDR